MRLVKRAHFGHKPHVVTGWWARPIGDHLPPSGRHSLGRRPCRRNPWYRIYDLWPLTGCSTNIPYIYSKSADTQGTAQSNGLVISTPTCDVGDTLVAVVTLSANNAAPNITLPTGSTWTS